MEKDATQEVTGTSLATVDTLKFRPLTTLGPTELNPKGITTNFPHQGVEAARFITQALAKEGIRLDDSGSAVFPCKYYLAHIAEFIDPAGEVIPMPRCVLIGPTGETMQFVSEGAMDSFDLIRSLCGDGPWNPPLPISVVKVRTRRGFNTYRLCLGEDKSNDDSGQMASGGNEPSAQGSDSKVPPKKRS